MNDYIQNAIKNDPTGITCTNCGKLNDLADDIGWFGKKNKALCATCFGPLTGDR